MNHWPFIVAAYGLALGGTLLVGIWSLVSMRRAETRADALTRRA